MKCVLRTPGLRQQKRTFILCYAAAQSAKKKKNTLLVIYVYTHTYLIRLRATYNRYICNRTSAGTNPLNYTAYVANPVFFFFLNDNYDNLSQKKKKTIIKHS